MRYLLNKIKISSFPIELVSGLKLTHRNSAKIFHETSTFNWQRPSQPINLINMAWHYQLVLNNVFVQLVSVNFNYKLFIIYYNIIIIIIYNIYLAHK